MTSLYRSAPRSPKGDLCRVKMWIFFAHVALRQPPLGGLGADKRVFLAQINSHHVLNQKYLCAENSNN